MTPSANIAMPPAYAIGGGRETSTLDAVDATFVGLFRN